MRQTLCGLHQHLRLSGQSPCVLCGQNDKELKQERRARIVVMPIGEYLVQARLISCGSLPDSADANWQKGEMSFLW